MADAERSGGLDALFREHSRWLTSLLRGRLGSLAADAEDIAQEAYLRVAAYQSAGRITRPRALLLTIARNLARDRARAASRRAAGLGPGGAELLGAQPAAADAESQLLLKDAILSLPVPLRDVFVLSRFTGMSYEEIAVHLGISVKTVEWRMSKALALCASRLRD